MAGGRRVLRSTASNAEERSQRQSPSIEPGQAHNKIGQVAGVSRATSNNKLNALTQPAPLPTRSSNTLRGLGPLGATPT
jgi:hypothetical protein